MRETTEAGHAGPTRPTTLGQGEKGPSVGRAEEQSEGTCLPLSLVHHLQSFSLFSTTCWRKEKEARHVFGGPASCGGRRRGRGASLLLPPAALPTVAAAWEGAAAPRLSGRRWRGQSRRRIIMKRNLASPSSAPQARSPAVNGGGGAGPRAGGTEPGGKLKKISSMVEQELKECYGERCSERGRTRVEDYRVCRW